MQRDDIPIELRSVTVSRTARYAVIGSPGPGLKEVWFVCHGYAQLARRFIERFRGIADESRMIVAPEALSRFYPASGDGAHGPASQIGASWMTSEDRENEIKDYVAYLDTLYEQIFASVPRSSVSVCALGFSQGATTVARWVAAGAARMDQVIIWAGSLPPELDRESAARLAGSVGRLILVAGTEDRFISTKVLEAQLSALSGLGVATEVVRFSGKHELHAATLVELAGRIAKR